MSSTANHLTSRSSPNIDTKYPIHHYLSFSRFSPTQHVFLTHITAQTKLKTYDVAVDDQLWQQAMNAEIEVLECNHTWSLVSLPPDHKTIGCL